MPFYNRRAWRITQYETACQGCFCATMLNTYIISSSIAFGEVNVVLTARYDVKFLRIQEGSASSDEIMQQPTRGVNIPHSSKSIVRQGLSIPSPLWHALCTLTKPRSCRGSAVTPGPERQSRWEASLCSQKHSIATLRRRLRFWGRLRPTLKPARNNLLPHHQGKGQRPVQLRCPFRFLGIDSPSAYCLTPPHTLLPQLLPVRLVRPEILTSHLRSCFRGSATAAFTAAKSNHLLTLDSEYGVYIIQHSCSDREQQEAL